MGNDENLPNRGAGLGVALVSSTFTTPKPLSLVSLALDSSGELVVAGSEDSFEIFLWSMQTGKLLDVLAGHEGPVTSVVFSPTQPGFLASGSWDKTYGRSRRYRASTSGRGPPADGAGGVGSSRPEPTASYRSGFVCGTFTEAAVPRRPCSTAPTCLPWRTVQMARSWRWRRSTGTLLCGI